MENNMSSKNLSPWWILIGTIFSFFYASILLSGWKTGLIPNLKYPYVYGGDATFMSWEIQRLIEGWLFDNPRSGYPFGSNFLDYAHSDNGNLLILKLFGMLTGTFYGALNLYLLTGFSVVFIVSFLVFKAFSLRPIYAFVAAMLFTFAPFHLWRLFGHIYYTWYFVVPIFFLYGWKIFFNDPSIWPLRNLKKIFLLFATLILLSSFGVYYAFFGVITLIVCGIAAALSQKKIQGFFVSLVLSSMLMFGVGLNVLPNLIYKHANGPNPETAYRSPKETEIYALKIAPLFFPIWNHRIQKLRRPIDKYLIHFDANEATFSSLGLIASLGLISLGFCIFLAALGRQIDIRLGLLSTLVLSFFLISTAGGLNVFFALYVSPLIRGWNRISIFISFASLTALFLLLQESKKLNALYKKNKLMFYSIPLFILGIGLLDQTPKTLTPLTTYSKNFFNEDQEFISKIESLLPTGSAIYQLPYMGFPEYGRYEQLSDYELTRGFINSKNLRWSHAGIKGREGDFFYRYLSKEPLAKQLDVIKRLGFSGIYIDRRGFSDNANDLTNQLSKLGYQPALVRKDKQIVFYRINPSASVVLNSRSPRQIMEQAGYFTSPNGPAYEAAIEEGIDFSRPGLPIYIIKSQGLSNAEPWGRWADANMADTVRFDFDKPLPNKFNLLMTLNSYSPNADKRLKIVVGSNIYSVTLDQNVIKSQLAINLKGEKTGSIEFFPPDPSSPANDSRKISVGFVRLQIESAKTQS
jgi:phosphoglycerol transferase